MNTFSAYKKVECEVECNFLDDWSGEITDSNKEDIQNLLDDGYLEGQFVTYDDENETEHYGWWSIKDE